MSSTNLDIIEEFRKRGEAILKVQESRRKQEEIIDELGSLIKDYSKDSFLPYLMQMINNIHLRHTSEAFTHLMSPMKQLIYLIDLFFSVENGGDKEGLTEDDWMQITLLLNEIEMTYFADIGFFNEGTEIEFDFHKVSVSLQSFLDYFGNAQLSFDEQTLERFEKICSKYNEKVVEYFGFSVQDAVIFSLYIRKLITQKLNDCNFFALNPKEWPKLTRKFIERGRHDPRDWWDEPEMKLVKEYRGTPGLIFIHNRSELLKAPLSAETINNIINFLTYKEGGEKRSKVYYADKNPFLETPLIKLNSPNYLCPQFKFLIESIYNRVNSKLTEDVGVKYIQYRNHHLEKKVFEVFYKIFGKEALIFKSYYFDIRKSEQDLLIIFKGYYFIVEIKDSQFRPPMRDPIKAFEKIKSDFKKSIQYGYNQCRRVEIEIEKGDSFKIFDSNTNNFLYEIKPKRIKDYFSIVVTQFKYGGIQTNLQNLLKKEDDAPYPWSICIDDLESFILTLKKLKRGSARTHFIEFLKYREAFHERLICSDELELCGLFINSQSQFKENSIMENLFSTFLGMSDVFDAEYQNGLGFENELDIEIKRNYLTPKYEKHYSFTEINGDDIFQKF